MTYCLIAIIEHFRKCKTLETRKRPMVSPNGMAHSCVQMSVPSLLGPTYSMSCESRQWRKQPQLTVKSRKEKWQMFICGLWWKRNYVLTKYLSLKLLEDGIVLELRRAFLWGLWVKETAKMGIRHMLSSTSRLDESGMHADPFPCSSTGMKMNDE